jgi:hypothetical protein
VSSPQACNAAPWCEACIWELIKQEESVNLSEEFRIASDISVHFSFTGPAPVRGLARLHGTGRLRARVRRLRVRVLAPGVQRRALVRTSSPVMPIKQKEDNLSFS